VHGRGDQLRLLLSAAGLRALADGLGCRMGVSDNFMNELLNSLCSLCDRLLPYLPTRT